MIKTFLTTMMAAILALSPVVAAKAATVGEAAPQFTAVDTHGVSYNLSDFAGKTVVLEWTNHQCPFVVKHYSKGNMQALQESATADDVVWLRVISSAPGKQGHVTGEEANKVAEAQGTKATATLLDETGAIGNLYGAKTTPHMFVIAADQTVAYAGAIDDNSSVSADDAATAKNYVAAALANINAGEAIEVASTQPYGCSVKY